MSIILIVPKACSASSVPVLYEIIGFFVSYGVAYYFPYVKRFEKCFRGCMKV